MGSFSQSSTQWRRDLLTGPGQKAEANVVPAAMSHIAVPLQILQGHHELARDEFRRFVLVNCCGDPPDDGLDYLNQSSWLVGRIVHRSTNEIRKMIDMSEMDVMKIHGKSGGSEDTAIQHYTGPPQIYRLLNEHCRGKL